MQPKPPPGLPVILPCDPGLWLIPLQVLLLTSYSHTLVTVRDPSAAEVFSAQTNSPSVANGLTPATNYSITLTLVFQGGEEGTAVTQLATTMDGGMFSPNPVSFISPSVCFRDMPTALCGRRCIPPLCGRVPPLAGKGTLSWFISFLPVPGDAPTAIAVSSLGPRSILVIWAPPTLPNGAIIGYTIYYSPPQSNVMVGVATSHNLTRLSPHTEYSIRVSARTSAGEGPLSPGQRVSTEQDGELLGCSGWGAVARMQWLGCSG